MRPLAIDLYCGLGGWTEGLLLEGFDVVGFDIERHDYGDGHAYPAQLVLQDVRTIVGQQFRDAALIVASPPCQEFSYRAMPWKRAKALPPPFAGIELFNACFRIQREACAAAGRHVPLVVENVVGAQRWVGHAAWHHGSYYLWGDVPALMPIVRRVSKIPGADWNRFRERGEVSPHWNVSGLKNTGGSWFSVGSDGANNNPVKVGGSWFGPAAEWQSMRRGHSKSSQRKRASAMIAKIPLDLARHVGRVYYPSAAKASRQ